MKDPSENLSCCSLDYDPVPERRGILAELTRTLSEYNSLLSSFASLRALPRATARDVTNLKNWHATYAHAIDDSERHDLGHEDGLFQLIPLQQSMFAVTLQHIPVLRSIFRTRRRSDHDEDGVAEYWSDTAMDSAATLLTLIAGLGMLLGSCWWLEHIDNEASRLDLITGSTTLFALGLWGAMGNKSAEVLTGTAGYMAILVIYLSH
nr:hypothetical protein B0A51_15147 [Rachicladosporium sp. CCFEE 5018]